jgi:hypothetical protein
LISKRLISHNFHLFVLNFLKGSPCNVTLDGRDNGRNPPRGDVTPEGSGTFTGGFNSLGYNAGGYDRRGFDKMGFKKNGKTVNVYSGSQGLK